MTGVTLGGAVAAAAALYAAVGHGGASAYLAVMALAGMPAGDAASGALVLNLVVAGASCVAFAAPGRGGGRLLWLFAVGSVPAAFLGGWVRLPRGATDLLLAACLLAAAARLWWPLPVNDDGAGDADVAPPPVSVALTAGAVIGFASGAVGIGGGVFLSPLLLLRGWAGPRRTAATSAGFIVLNSLAGLAARGLAGRFVPAAAWPWVLPAAAGGLVGAWAGSRWLSGRWLVRLLSGVLVVAATRAALK